jgi:hypothetical protein
VVSVSKERHVAEAARETPGRSSKYKERPEAELKASEIEIGRQGRFK